MTLGDVVIAAAILAHKEYPKDLAAAGRRLVSHCSILGQQPPANPSQFVKLWRDRMDTRGNIDHHGSNSGRKEKLTEAQVEEVCQAVIGWKKAGRQLPYETYEDAAENCETFKRVLAESGAALGTLVNRIKAKHPKFGRYQLTVRWKLSARNKTDRVSKCEKLLAEYREQLHKVVHLDAKTVLMYEKVIHGLIDLSEPYSVCRFAPAKRGGKIIRVKYYAAVNAVLGPVFMMFYTGTTGMPSTREGLNYKVSYIFNSFASLP